MKRYKLDVEHPEHESMGRDDCEGKFCLYSDAAKLAKAFRYMKASIKVEGLYESFRFQGQDKTGKSWIKHSKMTGMLFNKYMYIRQEAQQLYNEVMEND